MSSQYADEVPFETKFSNFREEVLSFGVPINAPINIQKLLEILDSKIVDKQFGRDIVGSIHNYIDKTMQPNFTLAQFFDACLRFRKAFNEKVETVQIELAKLQNERGEAEKALNKVKQFQQQDSHADKHNKILNLEVNGLQGLDLPNSSSVFAKLSCYNIRFITAPKQYTDQVSWKDKFPFEIQTGFERVDVTILAAPTTPQGKEEIIGVAQVHVSGIKDPKYSNEWANLYNGWSLTPVGRVKLGLEIMSSKVGYLERIIQKLDENIAMQIAEIEECEKKLKGFNGLILPPRASYCSSPAKMRQGFVSPTRRTLSDRNSIRVDASPEKCRTILEEEDGESSINSSLDILRLPELNVNYNSTPNPKLQPVESFRDLRSPSNKKESLTRLSERGTQNSNFSRPSEKKVQAPQRLVVYSQEGEIRARSPFPVRQKSEPNVVSVLTKESLNTNSSLETQSHSHSMNSEFLKNMLNASESSDKDAVINYLQKKLNDATRENEHLNNFIVGLTNENQKLKAENAKIPEFENLIQDYEDKICMLLEEVQKLDQLANQRRNENYAELQETRVLKSSLNQARYNNEYEVNKRTLNENIKMAHTLPFNKTPEILSWPQMSYENHSPFQSPREMGGLGDSVNKTQSSSGNSQTDIEKSRRVREPVKIFPDQRNGSVRRKEFVRPAY